MGLGLAGLRCRPINKEDQKGTRQSPVETRGAILSFQWSQQLNRSAKSKTMLPFTEVHTIAHFRLHRRPGDAKTYLLNGK